MLDKALSTNSGQSLKDILSEPNFNPITIGKRIDRLTIEIDEMRKMAFNPEGVDILLLKSKIAIRESLICQLKSLELLNHE